MSGLAIALTVVGVWMWAQGVLVVILGVNRARFGWGGRLAVALTWPASGLPILLFYAVSNAVAIGRQKRAAGAGQSGLQEPAK